MEEWSYPDGFYPRPGVVMEWKRLSIHDTYFAESKALTQSCSVQNFEGDLFLGTKGIVQFGYGFIGIILCSYDPSWVSIL